jgi:hypothetical protein
MEERYVTEPREPRAPRWTRPQLMTWSGRGCQRGSGHPLSQVACRQDAGPEACRRAIADGAWHARITQPELMGSNADSSRASPGPTPSASNPPTTQAVLVPATVPGDPLNTRVRFSLHCGQSERDVFQALWRLCGARYPLRPRRRTRAAPAPAPPPVRR